MSEAVNDLTVDTPLKEALKMGTRKNPATFGRIKGPNVIRNQSEMSYENENSSNFQKQSQ